MSVKERFLEVYDREHAITVRLLRAFPEDKADFRPNDRLKTAKELAWTFVLERGLGTAVYNDALAGGVPAGRKPQPPPATWKELLQALEKADVDYRQMIAAASDADLEKKVHFFTAPKTMGEWSRKAWLWFLLHDEIHHRGQFSVYMRAAGAKVPSIYGPTADEPWN